MGIKRIKERGGRRSCRIRAKQESGTVSDQLTLPSAFLHVRGIHVAGFLASVNGLGFWT
jgi:hypothetical protein